MPTRESGFIIATSLKKLFLFSDKNYRYVMRLCILSLIRFVFACFVQLFSVFARTFAENARL